MRTPASSAALMASAASTAAAAAVINSSSGDTGPALSRSAEDSSPASSPSPLTPPNLLSAGPNKNAPSPAPPPPFLLPEPASLATIHAMPAATSNPSATTSTTTPTRSKNDIFNAPSPILTPAPKLPSLKPSLPSSLNASPTPASVILPSLPSLPPQPIFNPADFGSPSSTALHAGRPPNLRISTGSSSSSNASSSASSFWQPAPLPPPFPSTPYEQPQAALGPDASLPVSGRARSPPASNPDIRIRLILSGQYLLGIGSHSDVYLGSYRFRSATGSSTAGSGHSSGSGRSRRWQLCAIKRLHPDRESLLLGLDEVFVLRRLGPHPNVVSLIDVRDEVDLVPERGAGGTQLLGTRFLAGRRFVSAAHAEEPAGTDKASRDSLHPYSAVSRPKPPAPADDRVVSLSAAASVTPAGLLSLKGAFRSNNNISSASNSPATSQRPASTFLAAPSQQGRPQVSGHARSTSDTYGDRSPTPPRNGARRGDLHAHDVGVRGGGMSASADGGDGLMLASSPAADTAGASHSGGNGGSTGSNTDPPRMLLLLELLPHQLSTYARLHPHRVTYAQWQRWATQLLSALAFFHARNLAHADIKKENCLLTDDLVLKVGDLGSAKWMESSSGGAGHSGGRDGGGLGTLAYSAPELARSGTGFSSRGSGFGPGRGSEAGATDGMFGVKVDIWSAGAVLYSLAIDQPPFSRARSTIDILNRKRNFFQTEEQDRTSRFDVEVGMASMSSRPSSRTSVGRGGGGGGGVGGTGSGAPSRHGSLRGRSAVASREGLHAHAMLQHARMSSENLSAGVGAGASVSAAAADPKQAQMASLGLGSPPGPSMSSSSLTGLAGGHSASNSLLFRSSLAKRERERDGSADSMDSLASSIQNMDGRSPSALAVAALLSEDGIEEGEGADNQDGDKDGNGGCHDYGMGDVQRPRSGLPAPSSLGLLNSLADGGRGDSSPLRKGTAALLSHSHARHCPSVAVDGVILEHSAGPLASGASAAGVRRTPSLSFRPGMGSSGVTRHHSVKTHSGLGHGQSSSVGGGANGGMSSSAAATAASSSNRVRATSVSGNTAAVRAVSGGPGPIVLDTNVRAAPYFGYGGSGSGGRVEDVFEYAPPTPIAETSEAEGPEREWELPLPASHRQQQHHQRTDSPHLLASPSTVAAAPRMVPSYSSLSAASTAASISSSYPRSIGSAEDDHGDEAEEEEAEEEEEEDLRPYADGSPPIVLPGGGRLPDAARDLLRAMLETDPRRRPSAVEVLAALERL
ncbi:hypothetical protein OC842_007475 [Tilletia horrida]|uniref:Protein kinase domain-containing protein n=1 Tax=Tilletia horrida TaxID=155126 RepID=A0AAN6G617_9BASI|nr:hypothetical protein OC842_007475 [Tilletia horrida]